MKTQAWFCAFLQSQGSFVCMMQLCEKSHGCGKTTILTHRGKATSSKRRSVLFNLFLSIYVQWVLGCSCLITVYCWDPF